MTGKLIRVSKSVLFFEPGSSNLNKFANSWPSFYYRIFFEFVACNGD